MAAGAAGGEIMEKYELRKDIGSGSFGVAKLARNKRTKQLVAMKFIPRGHKIDEYVAREIINHKLLRHPNIIRFKEVGLTPTHLAIAMEYAARGDLFARICEFRSEDKARYFFQQLVSGVGYCHAMGICHRDLTASNLLLSRKQRKLGDGHESYRLKICDFGFSKSSLLHSRPKSRVGTTPYMAPEIFSGAKYDGKMADVWSCGVILYLMLVGGCPFEDPEDPKNEWKTIIHIMDGKYNIPDDVHISQDCEDLLSRIFVTGPSKRITIKEIKSHPWFLKNLPRELTEAAHAIEYSVLQSDEEIMKIVEEARVPPAAEEEDVEEDDVD